MKILLLSLFTIFAFTHCSGTSNGRSKQDQTALAHCVDGSYEILADFIWDASWSLESWNWNAWKRDTYNISIASSDKTIFVLLKQKAKEGETAQVTCSEFDREDEKTLQARVFRKAKTNLKNFTSGISDLAIEKDSKKADACRLTVVQAVNPGDPTDKDHVFVKELDTPVDYKTLKKECDALDPSSPVVSDQKTQENK